MAYFDKYGVEYSDDKRVLLHCPKSLTGKYSVEQTTIKIAHNAFEGSAVTEVILNHSLQIIATEAFAKCTNIVNINIPNTVEVIEDRAFYGCENLNQVTLGKRIACIGTAVFSHTKLQIVHWNVDHYVGVHNNQFPFWNRDNNFKKNSYDIRRGILEFNIGNDVQYCPQEILFGLHLQKMQIGSSFLSFQRTLTSDEIKVFDNKLHIQLLEYNAAENINWGDIDPIIENIQLGNNARIFPSIRYKPTQYDHCVKTESDFYIPEGVEEICERGIISGVGIDKLFIPSSLRSIAPGNFSLCGPKRFVVAKDNLYFKYNDGILYQQQGNELKLVGIDSTIGNTLDILDGVITLDRLYNCDNVETIVIPPSIKQIHTHAFAGCSRLKKIIWNAVDCNDFDYWGNAFTTIRDTSVIVRSLSSGWYTGYCYPLYDKTDVQLEVEEIIFSDSVHSIPAFACNCLTSLKRIEIGANVQSIGIYAFANCAKLSDITISTTNVDVKYGAFKGTKWLEGQTDGIIYIGSCLYKCKGELADSHISVKSSCTYITMGAFDSQKGVKSVKLPPAIDHVDMATFAYCKNLSSIDAPNVSTIHSAAFYKCEKLKNVNFGELSEIEDNAFVGCSLLSVIDVSNVVKIGTHVFTDCKALKPILSEKFIDKFGSAMFAYSNHIESLIFTRKEDLESLSESNSNELGSSVKEVIWNISEYKSLLEENRNNPFLKKSQIEIQSSSPLTKLPSLKKVICSNCVKEIPDTLFCGCKNLCEIILPPTIESIGFAAFYGVQLNILNIPESVVSVDRNFLYGICITTLEWHPIGCEVRKNTGYIDTTFITQVKQLTLGDKVQKLPPKVFDIIAGTLESIHVGTDFMSVHKSEKTSDLVVFKNLRKIVWNAKCFKEDSPFYISNNEFDGFEWQRKTNSAVSNVSEFTIGNAVEELPVGLFAGLNKDAKIIFESTKIKQLPAHLFKDSDIVAFSIPSSVTMIDPNVFAGSEISSVSLDSNPHLVLDGHIIFTADKSSIVYVPRNTAGDVILPETLVSIPEHCFEGCLISSLTLPERITEIPPYMCAFCSNLKSVYWGKSVYKIGDNAFHGCQQLEFIDINENIREIGDKAFASTNIKIWQLPSKIEKIGSYALSTNEVIDIIVPESLKQLANDSFGYSKIKTVIWNAIDCADIAIPSKVIKEDGPFSSCLSSFIIGSKVKRLPANICLGAKNLTNVVIPQNVLEIGDNAFANCNNLEYVHMPDNFFSEVSGAQRAKCFAGTKWINRETESARQLSIRNSELLKDFKQNKELTKITLPSSITDIPDYAFAGCVNLEILEVPQSCEKFSFSSISSCTKLSKIIWNAESAYIRSSYIWGEDDKDFNILPNLTYIKFSESVKKIPKIGKYLKNVRTIEIGANVYEIEDSFDCCQHLERFVVHPDNPNFASVDGILYNKEMTIVLRVPPTYCGPINFKEPVEKIGEFSLCGCTYVDEIILPNSCRMIGQSAFKNCKALQSIIIPLNTEQLAQSAFDGCESLKILEWDAKECHILRHEDYFSINSYKSELCIDSLIISNKVEVIPEGFGSLFQNVERLRMGTNVRVYEKYAFYKCDYLKSIAFDNVIYIGEHAFSKCENIQNVILPISIEEIGNAAFSECVKLESVTWNCNIDDIPTSSFFGCANLKNFSTRTQIKVIRDRAFKNCLSLANIDLCNVENIGDAAFEGCNLRYSTIPEHLHIIHNLDFLDHELSQIYISSEVFELSLSLNSFSKLESIEVDPNNANYISKDGILYSSSAEILNIPKRLRGFIRILDGVQKITGFEGQKEMEGIILPLSLVSIGRGAFKDCCSLTTIIIPKNTKHIDSCAFDGCTSLKYIFIESDHIRIEPYVFNPKHEFRRYVPDGYGGGEWKTYQEGNCHIYQNGKCIDEKIVAINDDESASRAADAADFEQYVRDSFYAAYEGECDPNGDWL